MRKYFLVISAGLIAMRHPFYGSRKMFVFLGTLGRTVIAAGYNV